MQTIEKMTPAEVKAEKQVKFMVILGVDHDTLGRTAAVDVGPFRTLVGARDYARSVRGWDAETIVNVNPQAEQGELNPTEFRERSYPVRGASIEYYSDLYGTTDTVDVY